MVAIGVGRVCVDRDLVVGGGLEQAPGRDQDAPRIGRIGADRVGDGGREGDRASEALGVHLATESQAQVHGGIDVRLTLCRRGRAEFRRHLGLEAPAVVEAVHVAGRISVTGRQADHVLGVRLEGVVVEQERVGSFPADLSGHAWLDAEARGDRRPIQGPIEVDPHRLVGVDVARAPFGRDVEDLGWAVAAHQNKGRQQGAGQE